MRLVMPPQRSLDEIDIAAIKRVTRSRDKIPALLRGLQHIYGNHAQTLILLMSFSWGRHQRLVRGLT